MNRWLGARRPRYVATASSTAVVLLAGLGSAALGVPALAGPPGTDAATGITMTIDATTSPLTEYVEFDARFPYPSFAYVLVSVDIAGCPPGEHFIDLGLRQSGNVAWAVGGGLGAGELSCPPTDLTTGMTFAIMDAPPLRPGRARATATLTDLRTGDMVATAERLVTIPESAPTAPRRFKGGTLSATTAQLKWRPPVTDGGQPVTGYRVRRDGGTSGGSPWTTTVPADARAFTFGRLTPGSRYVFEVAALNAYGRGPWASLPLRAGAPGVPTALRAVDAAAGEVELSWEPPATQGASPVTGYRISSTQGGPHDVLEHLATVDAATRSVVVPWRGGVYVVQALHPEGRSGEAQLPYPDDGLPPTPQIGAAASGTPGGRVTATATWGPAGYQGVYVEGFVVRAVRLASDGRVLSRTDSSARPEWSRSFTMTLEPGRYRFRVRAFNDLGPTKFSPVSNVVRAR